MIKKLLLTVFLVVNLFLASSVFGQTAGDYRSNVATGNWATAGSWEYYNGSTWVAAANYPGQIAGSYAVLIQAGDVINIGTSGISTATMGTLTISGSLVFTGDNSGGGIDFIFNTQTLIVTPLLGTITMSLKVNLKLPLNASLQVISSNSPVYKGIIVDTSCTHNQKIYIGSSAYAYCQGAGTETTFNDLMNQGGYNIVQATSSTPVCGSVSTLTAIATPSSGAIINWYTVPVGGTPITSGASFTPTISTTTTYYVEAAYIDYTTPRTAVIAVVNTLPVPLVGTITQPTCTLSTGSVVVNGLPASGTWTLTRSPGGVTTSGIGTSATISGLVSGTYTYTVSNGSCSSAASNDVVINATTNIWNVVSGVGSWLNTLTNAQEITINGNYNSSGDLTACSCTVNAGVSVNINFGHTVTLTNKLTVAPTASMTFFDKASLVQINNVANFGDIYYVRTTNSIVRNTDYTYWSSPVSPQTLGDLYPLGSTFFSYEPTATGEDWKDETAGTIMESGKGYIANQGAVVPSGIPSPPGLLDVAFTGVPNNGHYEINGIFADKSYLLGNPYPSALDADAFLAANGSVLDGTLYFWTHNTAIQDANLIGNNTDGTPKAGSGAFAYTSDDYATYNTTGGVGTGNFVNGVEQLTNKPTGKIASGQGFFASSLAGIPLTSKIVFDNTMRVGVIDIAEEDNSQFFKTKNPTSKLAKVIEKNRVWLNMTNTQGAFKQTLVGYITNATNDFDDRFDGESYDGNEFVDFYSVNQDKNLVIQGRALPFDENDEVPLGYRTTINGAFTISIDQVDGLLTNQAVFIEDKLTNTVFDLKSGNYTFNTVSGTFNDRFVLKYSNKTLGTNTFDSLEKTVLVSNKNKQIKINSSLEMINKVTVFDLLGRQIYQKANVNSNELSISTLVSSGQVVIVKTVLQNGQEVNNKIVY